MRLCNRGSLNVLFAPKATELLRRRETTRRPITEVGSCVTSIAGPNGGAQLYER